jgi:hypothetical protein
MGDMQRLRGDGFANASPQRDALGVPEDVFRINLSLDLHQSREVVAPRRAR